ncbi:MT-A70-domain-containing protein [Violaceomyces palustris]|uniref:MT-A70-domain-containing protein n=1 Tax=Violaceomyces palustris TaxID=1673888 RepID=A0ACD0P5B6_9BASI|nr:MT-A70-domain-containing protein [Violaceomyces palustris]
MALAEDAEGFQAGDDAARMIASSFLSKPTAKQRILTKLMNSTDNRFQEFCLHLTREECDQVRLEGRKDLAVQKEGLAKEEEVCTKLHFAPVYYPQTDPSYGHCSYLNTCHRTSTCKYLHFQLDSSPPHPTFEWRTTSKVAYAQDSEEAKDIPLIHPVRRLKEVGLESWIRNHHSDAMQRESAKQYPAQWIDCDLKNFDYSILGKFDIIVADPPWDIHMSLPYGTMSDDDMRAMPFPQLQDEGLLFLWTTGRAMELGRELLGHWGYTRIDELIWVKVGQTQRLIRTGRTGHHLNHTKEHCLVGSKIAKRQSPSLPSLSNTVLPQTYSASQPPGAPPPIPSWVHSGLGTDVIVSEVRDTSRKPDELYGMIERLCPGGRKVELFGRRHNTRRGWITLGNQLKGDCIHDPDLRERLEKSRAASRAW